MRRRCRQLKKRLAAAESADLASVVEADADLRLVAALSAGEAAAAFALLEENMQAMYQASDWGWDPAAKRAELEDSAAHFVLARHDGELTAFAHFRFEVDDDDEPERAVLSIRELQTAATFRRRGIGRRCMLLLDRLAAALCLDALLLTVFKANTLALAFYTQKLDYSIDADDPTNYSDHGRCYHILSKKPTGKRRRPSSA